MTRNPLLRNALGALAVLGLLALGTPAGAVVTITTALEGGGGGAPDDELRTGGCSGCFLSQARSALSQFLSVERIFRGCGTQSPAGPASTLDTAGNASGQQDCDGLGGGTFEDYLIIQGVVKNSTAAANAASNDFFNNLSGAVGPDGVNDGLGVPGGDGSATWRVSSNGSGRGNECSRASGGNKLGIGFLAPEGFDGLPNTADDAGGTGAFAGLSATVSATEPAACNGADNLTGNLDDTCFPQVQITTCDNGAACAPGGKPDILFGVEIPPAGTSLDTAVQLSVVQWDLDGDNTIDQNARGWGGYQDCLLSGDCDAGRPGPTAAACAGGCTISDRTQSGAETANLAMYCDNGCMDLPGVDFVPARPTLDAEAVLGAQIFKFQVTNNVTTAPDLQCFVNGIATGETCAVPADCATAGATCQAGKPLLSSDDITQLFSDPGTSNGVRWEDYGLEGTNTAGCPFPGCNASGVNLALRVDDSGTRNTFREIYMTDPFISEYRSPDATPSAVFTTGGLRGRKSYSQFDTNGDLENYLQSGAGSSNGIGYLNAGRDCGSNCYDAVLDGVDPETNDLKLLTACGDYEFWGPLACGVGRRAGAATDPNFLAHRTGLVTAGPFVDTEDYAPKNQLAFFKNLTNDPVFLQTPGQNLAGCQAPVVPPAPHP